MGIRKLRDVGTASHGSQARKKMLDGTRHTSLYPLLPTHVKKRIMKTAQLLKVNTLSR